MVARPTGAGGRMEDGGAAMALFLASNLALGLALIGALLAGVLQQRRNVADLLRGREPGWRLTARLGFGSTAALALWGTLADNWRKMLGEALDQGEQFLSQRLVRDPVAPEVRAVTLALLIFSLLTMAPLLARYVGGYLLQIALALTGFSAFVPLYLLRQRLDTGLAGVFELPPLLSPAMLALIVFLLIDYAVNVATLLATYLALLGLVALPVTLALDLLGRREPPADSAEAAAFYAKVREGVAERRAASPARPREDSPPSRAPADDGGRGPERG